MLGIFELLMSIYTFGITFANSGMSLAATRMVSEELDGNSGLALKTVMRKCIIYSLCFGFIALTILCLSAKYCARHTFTWKNYRGSYLSYGT